MAFLLVIESCLVFLSDRSPESSRVEELLDNSSLVTVLIDCAARVAKQGPFRLDVDSLGVSFCAVTLSALDAALTERKDGLFIYSSECRPKPGEVPFVVTSGSLGTTSRLE